jgi:hypothetical protein
MKKIGLVLVVLAMVLGITNVGYSADIDFSGVYYGEMIFAGKGEKEEIKLETEVIMIQSGKSVTGAFKIDMVGVLTIISGIINEKGNFILITRDTRTNKDHLFTSVTCRFEGQIKEDELKGKLDYNKSGYRHIGSGMSSTVTSFSRKIRGKIEAEKKF